MNDSDPVPVILKDLPPKIRGFTCLGSDYNPIIVINSRLTVEQQRDTYLHELMHIIRDDLYNESYDEYGDLWAE